MLGSLFRRKPPSPEQQLATLASVGFRLLPEATIDALTAQWSREQFESDPYALALVALGGDLPPLAENVWHFDTECIEDHGDYARIAERFRSIANGQLPIADVEDFVDIEAGVAWLAFTLRGARYRWDCEVSDDWVDPSVMSRFAALLSEQKTDARYVYLDLKGQDCIIACLSADEMKRAKKETKLAFEWLT